MSINMKQPTFKTIPKMISVSDLQRRAKTVFEELEDEQPTLVLSRNRSVAVVIKPEFYEKMIEEMEDLYDTVYLDKLIKETSDSDFAPWEDLEKKLIKAGKLTPKS